MSAETRQRDELLEEWLEAVGPDAYASGLLDELQAAAARIADVAYDAEPWDDLAERLEEARQTLEAESQ